MGVARCAVALAALARIAFAEPARAGFDGVIEGPTLFSYDFGTDHLVCFSAAAPSVLMRDIPVTGLLTGEFLFGLDFRPATGELYAVGSSVAGDRVVTVDVDTGAVTPVSASLLANIPGGYFGIDFNPVVDRIRVVSNLESNLRLNPSTGVLTAIDTSLAYAAGDPGEGQNPDVTHAAYTDSVAGATTTTLYGIDVARDVLVRIGGPDGSPSPNTGALTTIGPLGIDATGLGGFDIDPATDVAWAALRVGAVSQLHTIDLATGAATLVGEIGSAGNFDALAVPEVDALRAGLGASLALVAIGRRRADLHSYRSAAIGSRLAALRAG